MFEGLGNAVLGFVHQYGFFAVFVYMVLETAFLLHYVPSEVVVPVAAGELVHGPLTFGLFVLDTTAGATVGSALAYVVFGRYGRGILERYGHVIHVSKDRLDWSETVFRRYGESSVFWGRMVPFLRAFISIPAGLAEMEFRRFVAYSAAGALLFDTGLTYLVYSGSGETSPLGLVVEHVRTEVLDQVAYASAHPLVVLVLGVLAASLAGVGWVARDRIRSRPEAALEAGLHAAGFVCALVGVTVVLGGLLAPSYAFTAITGVWNDPHYWVQVGLSERTTLLLIGTATVLAGVLASVLGRALALSDAQAALETAIGRIRNL